MSVLRPRTVLGGALAASLVASGVLAASFAADPSTGCAGTDPAGDASLFDQNGDPDGDIDIESVALAADAAGLTAQVKVVALQDYGTSIFLGDRHEVRFSVGAAAVVLRTSRYVDDPIANTYAQTVALTVGGAAKEAPSYQVVYDVETSLITYEVSTEDLSAALGSDATAATLTAISALAYAKTSPLIQTDLSSDTAALGADKAYVYGGTGCTTPPEAEPTEEPSGEPTAEPSGEPTAEPSGEPTAEPTATPSGEPTAAPTGEPTASATPTGAPTSSGTRFFFSGPTRVQHGDPVTTAVTLTDDQGQPLVSRVVTAKLGNGATVRGATNSAGKVNLTTTATDPAAKRNVVISFAGDEGHPAKSLNRAIEVLVERTLLTKSVSGSGSNRTLTMTLTDDDATKKPLANRVVTFRFSGKTVSVRTDSRGRASVTVRKGTAVDVAFAGDRGRFAAVTRSTRAE